LIGLFLSLGLSMMCGATYAQQAKPEAGEPSRKDGYIGGSHATGRVSDVYLKVGSSVFLTLDRAPESLRKSAERRVDVQFPDLLANGASAASAFISDAQTSIGIGDIVEIKFAHKSNEGTAPYFPVKEITRVTKLVAKRDEMLAKDYAQRILSRTGQGAAGATQLSASPRAMPAANQTTANASR